MQIDVPEQRTDERHLRGSAVADVDLDEAACRAARADVDGEPARVERRGGQRRSASGFGCGIDRRGPGGLACGLGDEHLGAHDETDLHHGEEQHRDHGQREGQLDRGLPPLRSC